ncbi:MAG: hypothetical protein ACLR56_02915 [Oscillospiraceae bacterium]
MISFSKMTMARFPILKMKWDGWSKAGFLEDAFIADEDETDAEQAYLNYLAVGF